MEAVAKALFWAINRDLFNSGESTQTICGNEYHFSYSEFGTEVTRNGDYYGEFKHRWELTELLCDLCGAGFDS